MPIFPTLVATDLDGTLLRHDYSVSARTLAALAAVREAGAEVVLVTARPPRFVEALAERTGLSGIALCGNGATVYDLVSHTVLTSRTLSGDTARTVAKALLNALPTFGFAIETGFDKHFEPGYTLEMPEDQGAEVPVASFEQLWLQDVPIVKILAHCPGHEADALVATAVSVAPDLAHYTHSGGRGLLEISAHGVGKAEALAEFCAERGIPAAEVIAFGDMPNDLSVLAWAGTGCAVANAHPAVLAAADRVTASNEEDGVAQVLEELLQGREY
ncbi:Cof subfamily protein (haloacid dehalogenase superfamily) [Crossiella equi]|uniref:Cof subfamily protein (Haloacid dehalogenase superfamily) n=1 Tax=Crossiella equi TaxID=130796 RepID=A0ABS5A8I8_9PSEU|nr:Cof-type HAD-IIB family hydrolase [Crossiella equi]MBP2472908.1 Cof subfamily protein (haloacid dehalogenase superfamily) [Crossiella equi]